MFYVSVALPRDFLLSHRQVFFIFKSLCTMISCQSLLREIDHIVREVFLLPSWLPAVDLDHLSTRAPPPGTVPCSVQGISQTTIPERGSGQHAAWTGRLPVQFCLAQLAIVLCRNVRVIDPTWSLPSVSTVITTFMFLILTDSGFATGVQSLAHVT